MYYTSSAPVVKPVFHSTRNQKPAAVLSSLNETICVKLLSPLPNAPGLFKIEDPKFNETGDSVQHSSRNQMMPPVPPHFKRPLS